MFNPFKKTKKEKPEASEEKAMRQPVKAAHELTQATQEAVSKNLPSGKYPLAVLIAPRFTEKAVRLKETENQYVFEIADRANAAQTRRAVEQKYGVRVVRVNILNQPGKTVRVGRREGWRSGFKKAMVTVAKGQSIEFT